MYCPYCGSPAKEIYQYCPNCGRPSVFNNGNTKPKREYSPNFSFFRGIRSKLESPTMNPQKGSKMLTISAGFSLSSAIVFCIFNIVLLAVSSYIERIFVKGEMDISTMNSLQSKYESLLVVAILLLLISIIMITVRCVMGIIGLVQIRSASKKLTISIFFIIAYYIIFAIPYIIAITTSKNNGLSTNSTTAFSQTLTIIRFVIELCAEILIMLGFIDIAKQYNYHNIISNSKRYIPVVISIYSTLVVLFVIELIVTQTISHSPDYPVLYSSNDTLILLVLIEQLIIIIKSIVMFAYFINTFKMLKTHT